MLSENFLLDSFCCTGNEVSGFEAYLNEIEKHTSFVKCESEELSLLSYIPKDEDIKKDQIGFFELDPQNLASPTEMDVNTYCRHIAGSYRKVLEDKILAKGEFESLIKELKKNTRLAIYIKPNDVYFTSNNIMCSMDRFGMAKNFLKTPCFQRDSIIAKQFSNNQECTLCVKSIKGVKKIFSIASGRYTPLDQKILLDIIKSLSEAGGMGEPKCYQWEITHFKSCIYVEFPEKAKEISEMYELKDEFIPGLWLATSDTSNCSLKIRGTWRKKKSITLFDEISRRHIGDINIPDIIKDVEKKIFSRYTKLPEALCDLMDVDITDSKLDLSVLADRETNLEAVKNALKNAFKQLGIVKDIGYKRMKSLLEKLYDEIDPSIHYTAYDIAMNIMGLPERVGKINPLIKEKLQKTCGLAPYVSYTVFSDEEDIILTA